MAETAVAGAGAPPGRERFDRYVLALDLRGEPEAVASYKRHHAAVWPEVVCSLQRAGVRGLEIHSLGARLVMIVEVPQGLELREVFERHIASGARVAEWEGLMKSFQRPTPGAAFGEGGARMELVCRLFDDPPAGSGDASPHESLLTGA